MAQTPANTKLWNLTIAQAKTHFRVYPSPAASHWVHEQYVLHGGKFVSSTSQLTRREKREHDTDSKTK